MNGIIVVEPLPAATIVTGTTKYPHGLTRQSTVVIRVQLTVLIMEDILLKPLNLHLVIIYHHLQILRFPMELYPIILMVGRIVRFVDYLIIKWYVL